MGKRLEKILSIIGATTLFGLAIWGCSICYVYSHLNNYEKLKREVLLKLADTDRDGVISQAEMFRYAQLLQKCGIGE